MSIKGTLGMQIPAGALRRAAVTPLWKLASRRKVICEPGRTHSAHIKLDLDLLGRYLVCYNTCFIIKLLLDKN